MNLLERFLALKRGVDAESVAIQRSDAFAEKGRLDILQPGLGLGSDPQDFLEILVDRRIVIDDKDPGSRFSGCLGHSGF